MATDPKWFEDKHSAAAKFHDDVGKNNVKIYDIQDFSRKFQTEVHPITFLTEKCTHVEVAVSGDVSTGIDWMVVVPYRVDSDRGGQKCYDRDPALFVFDTHSGSPHPSGVAAYHQSFDGRTTTIQGFNGLSCSQTVQSLRDAITTGVQPLESGTPQTLNALSHMYQTFGTSFM